MGEKPASIVTGNDFNFNSLKNTKFLVVCTSSMFGNPPKNFWKFYYHLKQASENPNKPSGTSGCSVDTWTPPMWEAMAKAGVNAPAVAWDAHWEGSKPNHHDKITDWELKKIEKKFGVPEDG